MTNDVNEFLNQGGVPSAKFDAVGKVVKGTVTAAEVQQQRDFDTGQPKNWDDGKPMMQLVITLQTDERDPEVEDDEGLRRLFAKGNMLNAIREAVRKSGGKLENGGKLAVKYTGDGEAKKRGFSPPKIYTAQYEAPSAVAPDVADLL